MRKIWRKQTANSEIVSQLASEINSTEIIATLLVNRNLVNKEEVENFFVPTLDKLPNPMLMSGIESSISRIIKAILKKEKSQYMEILTVTGLLQHLYFMDF